MVNDDEKALDIVTLRPSFFNFLIYKKIFKILESGVEIKI